MAGFVRSNDSSKDLVLWSFMVLLHGQYEYRILLDWISGFKAS